MSSLNFNIVSSGSKGNCTLVWDENNLLVFDFGITMKKFRGRLRELNVTHKEYSLFVSHEHSDHSSGIGMIRKYDTFDLYSRELTLQAIRARDGFPITESVALGNFEVRSISVSHDAADPVGYIIKAGKRKIAIISDLGRVSERLIEEASNSDILAFEANHDVEMLRTGRYPESLKQRILSNHGHLSNEQSAEAIARITGEKTRVILTHLSQENNTPDIALSTVQSYLRNRQINFRSMECASQTLGSSLFTLEMD